MGVGERGIHWGTSIPELCLFSCEAEQSGRKLVFKKKKNQKRNAPCIPKKCVDTMKSLTDICKRVPSMGGAVSNCRHVAAISSCHERVKVRQFL